MISCTFDTYIDTAYIVNYSFIYFPNLLKFSIRVAYKTNGGKMLAAALAKKK